MVGENKRKTEARLSGLILKIRKKGENERKVEERKVFFYSNLSILPSFWVFACRHEFIAQVK